MPSLKLVFDHLIQNIYVLNKRKVHCLGPSGEPHGGLLCATAKPILYARHLSLSHVEKGEGGTVGVREPVLAAGSGFPVVRGLYALYVSVTVCAECSSL